MFQQKVLKIYDTNSVGEKVASDITTCYFCAATFSATIGMVFVDLLNIISITYETVTTNSMLLHHFSINNSIHIKYDALIF